MGSKNERYKKADLNKLEPKKKEASKKEITRKTRPKEKSNGIN